MLTLPRLPSPSPLLPFINEAPFLQPQTSCVEFIKTSFQLYYSRSLGLTTRVPSPIPILPSYVYSFLLPSSTIVMSCSMPFLSFLVFRIPFVKLSTQPTSYYAFYSLLSTPSF